MKLTDKQKTSVKILATAVGALQLAYTVGMIKDAECKAKDSIEEGMRNEHLSKMF